MTTRPRHEEIADYLRELVGQVEPHDRMPSDSELCKRFSVSRMTARQAVQTLVNEGLVYREKGHGTFRSPHRVHRVPGSPLSFSEDMRRRSLEASSQVLVLERCKPTPKTAKALHIDPGDLIISLERLRFGGDRPMAIERAEISPLFPTVLDADLSSGSLHDVFEGLGHSPARAEASLSARRATKRERELLGLASTGVVLVEVRVIADDTGLPLERTTTCYAADRYTFDAVFLREETETAR